MKPLISICLPTYNRAEYLTDAINSCIQQTYKNWELLVVDDGATDSTPKLLESFTKKHNRIHIGRSDKNRGIAVTRNEAILRSKGQYIAVMDSDDVMYKERLKIALQTLKKTNADVFYSAYYRADMLGNIQDGTIPAKKLTVQLIRDNQSIPHVTIVAKTKCFKEHPYREELRVNDDMALIWDWYKAGYSFVMCPKPIMLVRFHEHSTSATRDTEIKKITLQIQKEIDKSGLQ